MRFRVLGPLELTEDDGDDIPIQGTKQRAVLGFLLLHANRVVSTSALMDALWPVDEAPNTARKILHNAIWGLRGLLGPRQGGDGRPSLNTRPPGYMLQLDTDTVDLYEFQRLAKDGRAQLAAGAADRAAATLRRAGGLWRGGALADLVEVGFGWPELAGLESSRIDALEDYAEAELALGHYHLVLRELEAEVESGTLRERLCGQLMVALYRCGRHTDALDAYNRLRRQLVEQLGLEPGRSLQVLQQAILRHDDSLLDRHPPRQGPEERTFPYSGDVLHSGDAAYVGEVPHSGEVPYAGEVPYGGGAPRSGGAPHSGEAARLSAAAAPLPLPMAAVPSPRRAPTVSPAAPASPVSAAPAAPAAPLVSRDAEAGQPGPGAVSVQHCTVVMVQATLDDRRTGSDASGVTQGLALVADALRYTADDFGGTVAAPAGPALLVVFSGADAPKRAVSTALAALGPCGDQGPAAVSVRATVVTGEAWLYRADGGPDAAPMVGGPVLDTCRTLMAHTAAGTVRVCEDTRLRTGGAGGVGYARSGGPVEGWRARSVDWSSLAHPSIPVVDRDYELDVLCGLLGRSQHRSVAQLVTVLGAAGSGKTRLVLEFERRAMARWDDAEFLVAGPEGADRPLGLLRGLLLSLAAAPAALGGTDAESGAAVLRQLAYGRIADQEEAAEVASGAAELVVSGEHGPAPHRIEPLRAAGTRLLAAVALHHPLVILVDDGHELDDASLDFLERFAADPAAPPLMLIVAARPELLWTRPTWGSGQAHGATLTLPDLTDATVDRLSDILLGKVRQGQLTLPTHRIGETLDDAAEHDRRRHLLRTLMRLDTSLPPRPGLGGLSVGRVPAASRAAG
ncbi:BTAD domain-containing putative transcriptional regulator [Actinomycetota bacterium Odt1-20B]